MKQGPLIRRCTRLTLTMPLKSMVTYIWVTVWPPPDRSATPETKGKRVAALAAVAQGKHPHDPRSGRRGHPTLSRRILVVATRPAAGAAVSARHPGEWREAKR